MNRILIALTAGLMLSPAMAEMVNRELDAAPDGRVDIFNTAGSITVEGWSSNKVEVSGELGQNVEELIVERDKDRIDIKVKVPRKNSRRIASDLKIKVPEKSFIDVSGVSADIVVAGVAGEQRLHTVSGDVVTEALGGDIGVESVSGDIEIERGKGDNETGVSTVSGDITVSGLSGYLDIEAVSGDITIDAGDFDRVGAETVNGDIVFRGKLRDDGKLAAESVNGDISIEFIGKVSARIDAETFNGDIDNCFGPQPQRTSRYTPGLGLSFTEGDGNGRVTLATLNGDMRICTR